MEAHRKESTLVCQELEVDITKGLSSEEAEKRLEKYGPNELDQDEEETIWDKIMEQFEDRFVRLLLLAAVISFIVSIIGSPDEDDLPPWVEPGVIVAILIGNGFIGIYQDYSSEQATQALKKMQSIESTVLRDSEWKKISSTEVVPGDIIRLSTGSAVPADSRIFKLNSLSFMVNEAPLTGETNEVNKITDIVESNDIQGKHNIVFSSTLVVGGSALVVAIDTGMKTEIGTISAMNQEAKQESKEEKTPLGEKLDGFGQFLEQAIFWTCVVIWLININNFWDPMLGGPVKGALYYFKIAIALAVAAIPEGLPAVITTCLALGTRRMTQNNAIIRKLPSVETLGCTTVICSDKTGTLTQNKMVASRFTIFGDSVSKTYESKVECDRYSPEGEFSNSELLTTFQSLQQLSDALIVNTTAQIITKEGAYDVLGSPTEASLLALGAKIRKSSSLKNSSGLNYINTVTDGYVITNINSFDSKRKMMSVLTRQRNSNENMLMVKGAPERVIDSCSSIRLSNGSDAPISNSDKDSIDEIIKNYASQGLRVIAVATKNDVGMLSDFKGIQDKQHAGFKYLQDPSNYSKLETELTLLALIGIQDPLRPEVAGSIKKCEEAGVCVFMVTGDNEYTAFAIGKECGIISNEDSDAKKYCMNGQEFQRRYENDQEGLKQELKQNISKGKGMIFARTSPLHKMQLVKILKSVNQIVAMTGDGVNDAPAIVAAHIGIAMGITGTEVAKECSSMILLDDNFATIVKAVEEGRGIYENMKAFIRYMISSNVGEVISIFISSLMGIPDGFNSIQLLWVNLVTDGIPAMALSFNPPDADIMVKPPRSNDDGIVDLWVFCRYMAVGLYIGIATVGIFLYWYMFYTMSSDGHTLVSLSTLSQWTSCPNWEGFTANSFSGLDLSQNPCSYFTVGKAKASTLSLSVLVMIEMFNAFNAISETQSLLVTGWYTPNPFLVWGVVSSVLLHCLILYIPSMNFLFSTLPLDLYEWAMVIVFSFPVIIIEEILKVYARKRLADEIALRIKEKKQQQLI